MKAWTTATRDGRCSYCGTPHKAEGRVFRLTGVSWVKDYCATCARQHHGAVDDTGEVLDVTDAPGSPVALKPETDALPAMFDQPFEDDRGAMPFDAKMAAAGRDD